MSGITRRAALGSAGFLLASAVLPSYLSAREREELALKAAGYRFPRVEGLFNKSVSVESCQVDFVKSAISDINSNLLSGPQTYDFAEIGLNPYLLAYLNDGFRDYTLLPIFPLRVFRHKSAFVHVDSGIVNPAQLKSKKVATPGYSSTSLTWIRGIFQDEYGLRPEDVDWVIAKKDSALEMSGKNPSKQENVIPDGISLREGSAGLDESELLLSGEVDAVFHAAAPQSFVNGNPKVRRLFTDSKKVEQEYYQRTSIFPIMHAVVIRTSLLEAQPWLAEAVFSAYTTARDEAYAYMSESGWVSDMQPWYAQDLGEVQQFMGRNWYSYGLEGNQNAINTLFRYAHEQGLCSRQVSIDEVFHPLGRGLQDD